MHAFNIDKKLKINDVYPFYFILFLESNLIGASEWTGTYNHNSAATSYPPYSPIQTPYSYDPQAILSPEHHSNYHLPAVLPNESVGQTYCPSEYHSSSSALIPHQQGMLQCPTTYSSAKTTTEMEQYSSYNNWSNGYNNYNYTPPCAPTVNPAPVPQTVQSQYATPHAQPTMVLYPQLYSTVNQNQIHLHLHGTDKLEQYFGGENAFTISSISTGAAANNNRNPAAEIGGTSELMSTEESAIKLQQDQEPSVNDTQEGVDPGSVWRPY